MLSRHGVGAGQDPDGWEGKQTRQQQNCFSSQCGFPGCETGRELGNPQEMSWMTLGVKHCKVENQKEILVKWKEVLTPRSSPQICSPEMLNSYLWGIRVPEAGEGAISPWQASPWLLRAPCLQSGQPQTHQAVGRGSQFSLILWWDTHWKGQWPACRAWALEHFGHGYWEWGGTNTPWWHHINKDESGAGVQL